MAQLPEPALPGRRFAVPCATARFSGGGVLCVDPAAAAYLDELASGEEACVAVQHGFGGRMHVLGEAPHRIVCANGQSFIGTEALSKQLYQATGATAQLQMVAHVVHPAARRGGLATLCFQTDGKEYPKAATDIASTADAAAADSGDGAGGPAVAARPPDRGGRAGSGSGSCSTPSGGQSEEHVAAHTSDTEQDSDQGHDEPTGDAFSALHELRLHGVAHLRDLLAQGHPWESGTPAAAAAAAADGPHVPGATYFGPCADELIAGSRYSVVAAKLACLCDSATLARLRSLSAAQGAHVLGAAMPNLAALKLDDGLDARLALALGLRSDRPLLTSLRRRLVARAAVSAEKPLTAAGEQRTLLRVLYHEVASEAATKHLVRPSLLGNVLEARPLDMQGPSMAGYNVKAAYDHALAAIGVHMPILDARRDILKSVQGLGRGSFGTVEAARLQPGGEWVAVKSLAAHVIEDTVGGVTAGIADIQMPMLLHVHEIWAIRVLHRAPCLPAPGRLWATPSHPGILQAYGVVLEESGVPSVLLEYAPGGALSAALPKLVPASATPRERLAFALYHGSQVASALAHMHGKGLLHLDVKPHNILIAAQGGSLLECAGVKAPPFGGWPAGGGAGGAPSSVAPVPGLAAPALAAAANRPPRLTLLPLHEVTLKVADFGISKAVAATAGAAATAMPVGTEGWRAPETYVPASAYAVKQTVSAKSDVYSVGIVLWNMWKGKINPYGMHEFDLAGKITKADNPLRPDTLGMQSDFASLLHACWAAKPAARPTMEQVQERLHRMACMGVACKD